MDKQFIEEAALTGDVYYSIIGTSIKRMRS